MYDQREYAGMTVTEYRDIDEMVAEIRKPGDVYVRVAGKHDLMQIRAVKSDLLETLSFKTGDDHGWALSVITFDDNGEQRRVVGLAH